MMMLARTIAALMWLWQGAPVGGDAKAPPVAECGPGKAKEYIELANKATRKKRFDEACGHIERSLACEEHPYTRMNLASCEASRGRLYRALELYDAAFPLLSDRERKTALDLRASIESKMTVLRVALPKSELLMTHVWINKRHFSGLIHGGTLEVMVEPGELDIQILSLWETPVFRATRRVEGGPRPVYVVVKSPYEGMDAKQAERLRATLTRDVHGCWNPDVIAAIETLGTMGGVPWVDAIRDKIQTQQDECNRYAPRRDHLKFFHRHADRYIRALRAGESCDWFLYARIPAFNGNTLDDYLRDLWGRAKCAQMDGEPDVKERWRKVCEWATARGDQTVLELLASECIK